MQPCTLNELDVLSLFLKLFKLLRKNLNTAQEEFQLGKDCWNGTMLPFPWKINMGKRSSLQADTLHLTPESRKRKAAPSCFEALSGREISEADTVILCCKWTQQQTELWNSHFLIISALKPCGKRAGFLLLLFCCCWFSFKTEPLVMNMGNRYLIITKKKKNHWF